MTREKQNYPWLKMYVDLLTNSAFMRLNNATAGIFLKLYLLAGRCNAGGLLGGDDVYTLDGIAWHLRENEASLAEAMQELINAGFVTEEGGGYAIVRFLEEQGPGEETNRAQWRARQAKRRAKLKGEERDEDTEREGDIDRKKEEDREEEEEGHGDVTVTPPPRAASSFSVFEVWRSVTGKTLPKNYYKALQEAVETYTGQYIDLFEVREDVQTIIQRRLAQCWGAWKRIVEKHNEAVAFLDAGGRWELFNPDAVIELIPMPILEGRMEREGMRWENEDEEQERLNVLDYYSIDSGKRREERREAEYRQLEETRRMHEEEAQKSIPANPTPASERRRPNIQRWSND